MSWTTLKLAWAAAEAEGLDIHSRTVLLDLARLADSQGCSYPSVSYLARHPGLSERKVYEALTQLEDLRFIGRSERKCPRSGRQKSSSFTVHIEVLKSGSPTARGAGRPTAGGAGGPTARGAPLTTFDIDKGFKGVREASLLSRQRDGDCSQAVAGHDRPIEPILKVVGGTAA